MLDTLQNTTISSPDNTASTPHIDFTKPAPRYITQLTHAEYQPVGKVISIDRNTGGLVTESSVAVSVWLARTVQVDSLEAMAALLGSQESYQALILDYVPQMVSGEEYYLVSAKMIAEGWQPGPGDSRKVVQLKKDLFTPSGWVCLDWDYDAYRAAEHPGLQDADIDTWWRRMCEVNQELIGIGRITLPSSKSQVVKPDGSPAFSSPSYHTYLMTENRQMIENVGKIIEMRFWLAGQGYEKEGKHGTGLKRTPFDPCTWSISRRVFESQPVVGGGLGLVPREIRVEQGGILDLAGFTLKPSEVDQYKELTQRELSSTGKGGRMRVICTSPTLMLDQVVETQEYGEITVRQYQEDLDKGEKLRCQTPFRESDSWAGYLNRHENGEPFLYDVGSGTKYVVPGHEWHSETIAAGIEQGTGEAPVLQVPAVGRSELEATLESLSYLDVSQPAEIKRFLDHAVEQFEGLELDKIVMQLKKLAKPFLSADGIKAAVKEAKLASRVEGRRQRAEIEKEQQKLKEQVSGLLDSHPDGVIHNPSTMLSIDAVGYPLVIEDAEGRVETVFPVVQNLRQLCSVLGISVQRNLMNHTTEILIPNYTFAQDDPHNHSFESLKDIAISSGLPTERLPGMVSTMASEFQYHPMSAWLEQIGSWDRVSDWIGRIGSFIEVEPGKEAARDLFLKRWLVSGIAFIKGWRNKQPKCVLTLAGAQDVGKTAFLRMLCPNPDWFLEGHLLQPGDKDSESLYASHFMVELGEVDSTFRKADIAALKAFLSKGRDLIRLPYQRAPSIWKRRTLPCASVNELDFLVDDTGNSRFWPIECLSIDFEGLNAFYEEGGITGVWQQANALYMAGEPWWLDGRQERDLLHMKSEEHRKVCGVEQRMLDMWDWSGWVPGEHSWDNRPPGWRVMTATDIAIELGFEKSDSAGRFGVAKPLRQILKNYTGQVNATKIRMKDRTNGNSHIVKGWRIPPKAVSTVFFDS